MKISVHVRVHITTILWKFSILNPKSSRVILLLKFVNFLKTRLIFNIFYCFWMFLNKLFTYLMRAYLKKYWTYYFPMKTKTLGDFQICISVPLTKNESLKSNFSKKKKSKNYFFMIRIRIEIFVTKFCKLYNHFR